MRDKQGVYSAAKAAICISLLVASAYIVIPMPPSGFSFMTVMVSLMGLILTPLQSALALTTYLLMGLIGLPVFSGGTGGAGKLFGVTGGYYFSFLVATVLISLLKGKDFSFKRYTAVTVFVGIPIEHLCAVLMMCLHNGFDIKGAFVSISLPFIVGDIVKAVAASFIGVTVNKRIINYE
ncbi:MAG: biotin transporter BioY [Clostridia bacterium]|nr:biotin transporter BioY [Clostridia bacterium]